ncbi:MAG: tetratricopeptide repeat protein, partial [Phycisphaeraceae bacterium]
MQANPGRADAYAEALLAHYEEPVLLSELDRLSATASGLYLRGKLYEIDGRTEEAIAEYEQALELDPAFAASHLALVELQIQLERYEQALSLLDEMGEVGDRRSRLARARIYAGLERVEDAIEVLESLIEDHASRAEPRLLLAEMQVRQRQFDAAAETLWAALELEPENERAYELLFDVHDENPRTQASERLRLLREVQQEIPESRIARLRMVTHWHLPRAEFDEAERVLRTLLEDDRQDYEALSRLVGILGHTDRWAEAQEVLVAHLEAGAEDEEADVVPLLLLEEVVKHTDDTALFYREMERFLDRQEPSAETYVQLARLYESDHLDRPDKAVEVLRKAVALQPEFVDELRLYLVQLLYRLERTDEALAELTKAIEGNPDQAPDLYAFKATIHHDVGQIAEAERMLKAALEIDPAHAGANNDLAYYWAEQDRNLEQALGMARTAIGAEPDNGAYLDTAGWIYY